MSSLVLIITIFISFYSIENLAAQTANFNNLNNRFQRNNEQLLIERSIDKDRQLLQNVSKKILSQNKIKDSNINILDNINKKCFLIYKFHLKENKLISQKFFQKKVSSFIGQCLTLQQIQQIKYALNNHLYSKGFITSQITIPKQNIASGEIYFDVFIGKIAKVTVQNKSNFESAKKFTITGGIANNTLNIKTIDIINSQLNTLPSKNYKVKITPSKTKNFSDVFFNSQSKNFDYSSSILYDNLGNDFTGKYRTSVNFNLEDALSIGDLISVSISDNLNDSNSKKDLQSNFLSVQLPIRSLIVNLSTSYASYFGKTASAQGVYKTSGFSKRKSVSIEKILINSPSKTLKIGSSLSLRESSSDTFLSSLVNSSDKKFTIIEGSLSGSIQLNRSSKIYYNGAVSSGLRIGNANNDNLISNEVDSPKYQFKLLRFYANYNKSFKFLDRISNFSSQINSQISQDVLHGADQFSIGGFQSVRGFSESYIAGDHGFFTRNSISFKPFRIKSNLASLNKLTLSPFFDYGKVSNRIDSRSGNLSGAGLEARYNSKYYNLSITYAKTLNKSKLIDSQLAENHFVYFNFKIQTP